MACFLLDRVECRQACSGSLQFQNNLLIGMLKIGKNDPFHTPFRNTRYSVLNNSDVEMCLTSSDDAVVSNSLFKATVERKSSPAITGSCFTRTPGG